MATENGLGASLLGNGFRTKTRNAFASSASVVLAVLLVLLAVFTKYTEKHQGDDDVQRYYTWYLHVSTSAPAAYLLSCKCLCIQCVAKTLRSPTRLCLCKTLYGCLVICRLLS